MSEQMEGSKSVINNPGVEAVLKGVISTIEQLVKTYGPDVLDWIDAELNVIENKYLN